MKKENTKTEISQSERTELTYEKTNKTNALSVSEKNNRIETFVSTVIVMLEKYNIPTN